MSIELLEITGREPAKQHFFEGPVLHFGSSPPSGVGKQTLVVIGREVAEHHAKLFHHHGEYWMLNLCGLPCAVLKTSGRTVFLTATDSIVEVEPSEAFQIGETTYIIVDLKPPQQEPVTKSPQFERMPPDCRILADELRASAESCESVDFSPLRDARILNTVFGCASDLNRYVIADEMWRRTGDRIAEVFADGWKENGLAGLLAVGTFMADDEQVATRVTSCAFPELRRQPDDLEDALEHTGIPVGLNEAVGLLVSERNDVFHSRCHDKVSKVWFCTLAGPVVKEEAEIGEIVLLARWQREPPPVSSQDCLHLFRYLLSNLSLALTLLRQHQQAAEFARIHDIGTAALMAAHDEYNLADRAEAVLNEVHRSAANEPLLKKVDTILQHIRAVGRTRVQFVRKKRIRLEPDDLCNCSQMVREWFMDLAWLIADDFIQIDHAFELDRHVFLAGRDGVLACLRNLQSNAVKAVQSAEKEPFWIRCDATYRTPVDTDENLADCALQYVVLAVANSGKCIPQNLKLFEHRIAESASGHGLGSQIVRWVMDEHRGLIQYTSRDGETRIELWFPNLRDPSLEDIQIQWVKYDEYRNRVGPVRRGE